MLLGVSERTGKKHCTEKKNARKKKRQIHGTWCSSARHLEIRRKSRRRLNKINDDDETRSGQERILAL